MWTVQIKDQTARFVQSDLDLHYPQTLLMSSSNDRNILLTKTYQFIVITNFAKNPYYTVIIAVAEYQEYLIFEEQFGIFQMTEREREVNI